MCSPALPHVPQHVNCMLCKGKAQFQLRPFSVILLLCISHWIHTFPSRQPSWLAFAATLSAFPSSCHPMPLSITPLSLSSFNLLTPRTSRSTYTASTCHLSPICFVKLWQGLPIICVANKLLSLGTLPRRHLQSSRSSGIIASWVRWLKVI